MNFVSDQTPDEKGFSQFMLLVVLSLAFMAVLSSGCSPQRKLRKQQQEAAKVLLSYNKLDAKCAEKKHLDSIPANYCATRFPTKQSSSVKIKYLPGKRVLVPGDTQFIEVDCDSAIAAFKATNLVPVKVRVPYPVYVQVDTSAILSEVVKTDAAKEEILRKRAEHAEHGLLAEVQRNNALQVRGDNAYKWLRYSAGLNILLLLVIASGIYLYAKK
jgi:hypothetical protein